MRLYPTHAAKQSLLERPERRDALSRFLTAVALVFMLLLSLLSAGYPALEADSRFLWGPGGYRERSFGGTATFPWKSPRPDPKKLISGGWISGDHSTFDRRGSRASHRSEISGGVELFDRSALDLALWWQPAPLIEVGAYRADGISGGLTFWGPGWIPNLLQPAKREPVQSEFTFFTGLTRHQERIQLDPGESTGDDADGDITQPRQVWLDLDEGFFGGSLRERFPTRTSVVFTGEYHGYNRDLQELARDLDVFTLISTDNTAAIELLYGFVETAWGAGIRQNLGSWARASFDWRRSNYALGISPRSDTFRTRLSFYVGDYVTLRTSYEAFKPHGSSNQNYYGLGLSVGY
jgi:hypothetical protein